MTSVLNRGTQAIDAVESCNVDVDGCNAKGQGQNACWDRAWRDMEPYLRVNFGPNRASERMGMKEIVSVIEHQITSDLSLQGCRLPPIRVLAHQLGVSKNTVSAAYDELCAKSLVESRGRKGLYISTDPVQSNQEMTKKVPLPTFKTLKIVHPSFQYKPESILLSSVFIDPKLLPKEKLTACFRSVLKSPGLANFSDPQGFLPLRQKIAQRLRKRGIEAEPEQIVTTIGSQQGLDLVFRCLKSKVVATENPAYYVGKALLEMNDITPLGLPIEPFQGIDLKKWESLISSHRPGLVYLTSNFQNPTGYSYTTQEMAHIIEWSRRYGFGILEDDWGSDMLSYSEFKPSIRAMGGTNVFYMNSFTKKLLPSLRLGYVIGNEHTVSSLIQVKRLSISGVPAIVEAALFEFLDRGYYDTYLKKIQKELDNRYQNCLNLLRTYMPHEARWTTPGGGPVLWLELPRTVKLDVLIERLKLRNVLIQSSQNAFFDSPHLHGFKIGYAFISTKQMQIALEILADELRALV